MLISYERFVAYGSPIFTISVSSPESGFKTRGLNGLLAGVILGALHLLVRLFAITKLFPLSYPILKHFVQTI